MFDDLDDVHIITIGPPTIQACINEGYLFPIKKEFPVTWQIIRLTSDNWAFDPGRMVITPELYFDLVDERKSEKDDLLTNVAIRIVHHLTGDPGEVCEEDRETNDYAIKHGGIVHHFGPEEPDHHGQKLHMETFQGEHTYIRWLHER